MSDCCDKVNVVDYGARVNVGEIFDIISNGALDSWCKIGKLALFTTFGKLLQQRLDAARLAEDSAAIRVATSDCEKFAPIFAAAQLEAATPSDACDVKPP